MTSAYQRFAAAIRRLLAPGPAWVIEKATNRRAELAEDALGRYRTAVDDLDRWCGHTYPQARLIAEHLRAAGEGLGLNAGTPCGSEACTVSGLRQQLARLAPAFPTWIGFEQPDTLLIDRKRYTASLLGRTGLMGERGALLTIESNPEDEQVTFRRMHSSPAVLDVLDEREWQINVERFMPAHDDEHDAGEMAAAAAAYALSAADRLHPLSQGDGGTEAPLSWPWDASWWRPKTPREDLVRAAALAIAEIDKLDRQAAKAARMPSMPAHGRVFSESEAESAIDRLRGMITPIQPPSPK